MTIDLLPKSIQQRVILNFKKGMSIQMSIQKAFEQEEKLILSMLSGSFLSDLGYNVISEMSKNVYKKLKNV